MRSYFPGLRVKDEHPSPFNDMLSSESMNDFIDVGDIVGVIEVSKVDDKVRAIEGVIKEEGSIKALKVGDKVGSIEVIVV